MASEVKLEKLEERYLKLSHKYASLVAKFAARPGRQHGEHLDVDTLPISLAEADYRYEYGRFCRRRDIQRVLVESALEVRDGPQARLVCE